MIAPAESPKFFVSGDMSARGQFDLVGHNLIKYEEFTPGSLLNANNIIVTPDDPQNDWMRALMVMIGDWRATLRSTYIRWAMAINGLHVAAAKYREDRTAKGFVVRSVRADGPAAARTAVIAKYSFEEAAEAHLRVQPMLCAHGFIDMYAGLEEMVFSFYRKFLSEKPDVLLRGPEFAGLRKLYRDSSIDAASKSAWETALSERLDQWQRKKLYEGLDKVFLGFSQNTGLKVALIRNLLIHGENIVPQELADFCSKPYCLGLHFEAGKTLRLSLLELQVFEAFTDQLLTALNLSLVELAHPELRKEAEKHFRKKT